MASYTVNQRAVTHARKLIRAHQYVLESDRGDAQPSADDENAFIEAHSWDEFGEWFLGLTEGASDETKARYGVRLRRLPSCPSNGPDRESVSRRRVAEQGGRARRSRPAAGA